MLLWVNLGEACGRNIISQWAAHENSENFCGRITHVYVLRFIDISALLVPTINIHGVSKN